MAESRPECARNPFQDQVLLVIAVSRVILTLAYIRTKNIWVLFGAHLIHDWVGLVLVVAGGSAAGTAVISLIGM